MKLYNLTAGCNFTTQDSAIVPTSAAASWASTANAVTGAFRCPDARTADAPRRLSASATRDGMASSVRSVRYEH